MLARLVATVGGFGIAAFKTELLHSYRSFLLLNCYSTTAALTRHQHAHCLENYLVSTLRFTQQEAIAIAAKRKYIPLKPRNNPDLVLDFLEKSGFDETHIKKIISGAPDLLYCNVEKILKPKLKVLQDLGLSGSDLARLIVADRAYFMRRLKTFIRPSIDFLREVLGSDDNVVKAIKKSSWLLSTNAGSRLMPNVLFLRNIGVSDDKIKKLMYLNPRCFVLNPKWFQEVVRVVEKDLRISLDSPMFLHAINAFAKLKKPTLEIKLEVFRSFGWSDKEVMAMARSLPYNLTLSVDKLRKGLEFYMTGLGCTPGVLVSNPSVLGYSLEKRVMPRYEVIKRLNGCKLNMSTSSLFTVVKLRELKFRAKFVLPYKDNMPDMYELYIKGTLEKKIQK